VFSDGRKSPNTALFIEMVTRLGDRARRTGKLIVLVLDNGTAHTSKRSRKTLEGLEGLVNVLWLPPYSSEQLNDIEGLWKHLKEDHFSRMLVRRRERFAPAARALLRRLRTVDALRRALPRRRARPPCRKLVKAA
jgi:transposase